MKLLVALLSLLGSTAAFAPALSLASARSRSVVLAATNAAEDFYIDDERRFTMNVIMVGSGLTTVAMFGIPFVAFFFPPGSGSGNAGVTAKDALGADIVAKTYLAAKQAGDRSLAQGLKGDAT
jgi:cytochrome b6-f complex iron-sulfur subunit